MSTLTNSTTIECLVCHQPTSSTTSQPVHLLLPTGRFRAGVEILQASATLFECSSCLEAEFEASETPTHIYTVHTCGTTRTIGATTPEEAAVLMLQDRGWTSTRSIAVIGAGAQCEFLDCERVGDHLQYSERVELP
jgi:hypothetical protein